MKKKVKQSPYANMKTYKIVIGGTVVKHIYAYNDNEAQEIATNFNPNAKAVFRPLF